MNLTNDLADWFPLLNSSGVNVPKTEIIKTDVALLAALFDGTWPNGIDHLISQIGHAGGAFGFPCFLRTGHTSAKHSWEASCFLPNGAADTICRHIMELVEYGEMSSLIGLPVNTWVVRQLLPTVPAFMAFGGLPITKERRYFIENGKVTCHHPYWPASAIAFHADNERWPELLAAMNTETPEEVQYLTTQSERVASRFADLGTWSLDWLETRNGWFAIDMAIAADSYHWPECANEFN